MHIRILQQVKDGRLQFPYRQPLTAHTLEHEASDNPQEKKEEREGSIKRAHREIRTLPHWNKKLTRQRCTDVSCRFLAAITRQSETLSALRRSFSNKVVTERRQLV